MEITNNKRKRALILDDRKACIAILLMHCEEGELKRGSFVKVVNAFESRKKY
jgi:hypothetical protein